MCGIVGYIGTQPAVARLLHGLRELDYPASGDQISCGMAADQHRDPVEAAPAKRPRLRRSGAIRSFGKPPKP